MKSKFRFVIYLLAFLLVNCPAWADWKPFGDQINTRGAKEVAPENAWREYPRPQRVRKQRQNLKDLLNHSEQGRDSPENHSVSKTWNVKILDTICIESCLSGVGRLLKPGEELCYERMLEVSLTDGRQLHHFDAVNKLGEICTLLIL